LISIARGALLCLSVVTDFGRRRLEGGGWGWETKLQKFTIGAFLKIKNFMKWFDKGKWSEWDGFTILWSRMVKRELVCFCYFLLGFFFKIFISFSLPITVFACSFGSR